MYEKGRIILAKQNSVIIDPGHGGSDPGAVYGNRREKDDTLALAYDIGNALEQRGIRVEYTRIGDIYNSPLYVEVFVFLIFLCIAVEERNIFQTVPINVEISL